MPEYIERNAAMLTPVLPKEYRQYQTENLDDAYEQGWLDALGNLKNAPTADVAPVVHGRWVPIPEYENKRCSVCRTVFSEFTLGHYCPHCGARMDGENDKV